MKNQLYKLVLLFGFIFGLTALQKAYPSHYLTADLTYTQTAPATYVVKLHLVRDCNAGHLQPPTLDILVGSAGCSGNRVAALALQPGTDTINQNCLQVPAAACLKQKYTYSGTVTLSAPEQNCQNIVFSWSDCCRPNNANTVNPSGYNIYTEALVKVGAGILNSSPGISPLHNPVPEIPFGTEMIFSLATSDPDCDSVSYELVAPLTAANSPVAYAANSFFGGNGVLIMNPCPLPPFTTSPFTGQYGTLTGQFPQQLSPAFPIPAISAFNWNSRPTVHWPGAPFYDSIWSAPVEFGFDPVSGQLKFTPAQYVHAATLGENKYLVEVKVNEWRKVNGIVTLVGSTRRGMLFTIINNNSISYSNPTLVNIAANGHGINSGDIITLRPGMPLTLNFRAATMNCNAAPLRSQFSSDVTTALPGATFLADTTAWPEGTITWIASQPCVGIKFFQVKVEDNACPVKGFQTHTFGVRVSATARVTGMPESQVTVSQPFFAFPNPFNSQVKFMLTSTGIRSQQLMIYNSVGQLVDQLEVEAGQQEVTWEKAASQTNGLYIARLVQNGQPIKTIRFMKAN